MLFQLHQRTSRLGVPPMEAHRPKPGDFVSSIASCWFFRPWKDVCYPKVIPVSSWHRAPKPIRNKSGASSFEGILVGFLMGPKEKHRICVLRHVQCEFSGGAHPDSPSSSEKIRDRSDPRKKMPLSFRTRQEARKGWPNLGSPELSFMVCVLFFGDPQTLRFSFGFPLKQQETGEQSAGQATC